jgi:hypothetical protein
MIRFVFTSITPRRISKVLGLATDTPQAMAMLPNRVTIAKATCISMLFSFAFYKYTRKAVFHQMVLWHKFNWRFRPSIFIKQY